jgi:Cu/Ag efflux pump CusA
LLLVVEKFPGADTREITDGVEEALSALKPGLSGVDIDPDIYQARSFIDTALQNLGIWAIAGPGLLLVVLALVFFSWRPVVVGFASIVLSLIAAMFVLFVAGVPFNGMILAGLAVAVGLVINDALADLPVIRPKLAELPAASDSGTKVQVLGEVIASQRTIQLFATLVVLVAALPLLFLSGLANDFATPAVIAYMAAVVISTLVALTLAPTLAFFLLKNGPAKQRNSPLARPAGRLFDATVSAFLRQPRWAVDNRPQPLDPLGRRPWNVAARDDPDDHHRDK